MSTPSILQLQLILFINFKLHQQLQQYIISSNKNFAKQETMISLNEITKAKTHILIIY